MIRQWLRERRAERLAEREAYLKVLSGFAESQAKQSEALIRAVESISATQTKQVEAISTHLSLFATAVASAPQTIDMGGRNDDRAWAEANEFPFDGTPEEQMKWIAAHDSDD